MYDLTNLASQIAEELQLPFSDNQDVGQFTYNVLTTVIENRETIPFELLQRIENFFRASLEEENCAAVLASTTKVNRRTLFSLVVETGLVSIAKLFVDKFDKYDWLSMQEERDDISYRALESGSSEMVLWIESLDRPLLNTYTITSRNLEREIKRMKMYITKANSDDPQRKKFLAMIELYENLRPGIDTEHKMRGIIRSTDLFDFNFYYKMHKFTNSKIEWLITALQSEYGLNRALIQTIIDTLPLPRQYEVLPADLFICLCTLKLLKEEEINSYLQVNAGNFSKDELAVFMRIEGCLDLVLPQLLSAGLENLETKDLLFLIKNFDNNQQIIHEIYKLSLKKLLENDLLFELYALNPKQFEFALIKENASKIIKINSLPLLALLASTGFDKKKIKNKCNNQGLDYLSLLLIAASLDKTEITTEDLLTAVSENEFSLKKIHQILAGKLKDKAVYKLINSMSNQHAEPSEVDIEAVKTIQGAIRTQRRAQTLYPGLFHTEEKSYLFWLDSKPKTRRSALKGKLLTFANNFLQHHAYFLSNGQLGFLPSAFTFQIVHDVKNLHGILRLGYLLSESGRQDLQLPAATSYNKDDDRAVQDDKLVCTGPFKIMGDQHSYTARIKINLTLCPPSYLRHCVIKLSDFVGREDEGPLIQVTPHLTLQMLKQDSRDFSQSSYQFNLVHGEQRITYILTIPGEHEIFHGFNGFQESLNHFFLIINDLPDTAEGQLIKNEILQYFQALEHDNQLNNHLDHIFENLYQFMEIDFQRGLPFSLDYLESIRFLDNKELDFKQVVELINKGDFEKLKAVIETFPFIFSTPIIIDELLKKCQAHFVPKIYNLLQERYPYSIVFYENNFVELMRKNLNEVKEQAQKCSMQEPLRLPHNPLELYLNLEQKLMTNKELRKELIQKNKQAIENLQKIAKVLFTDVKFSGVNSKLREFIATPNMIEFLAKNNQDHLAGIIAIEIEAALQHQRYCTDTHVMDVTSQHSLNSMTLTLGSIFKELLKQPLFFMEACPINLNYTDEPEEKALLNTYIQQKTIVSYSLNQIEKSLLDTLGHYWPEEQKVATMPNAVACYAPYNYKEWASYEEDLITVLPLIAQSFCQNDKIPDQVNTGIKKLLKKLGIDPQEKNSLQSLDQLVDNFIHSSLILVPKIAHLVFDTSHFGVALTAGALIQKIPLKNNLEVSFDDFIKACVNKIAETGVNSTNALLAEQLALRIKQLQFWCLTNNILLEPSPIPNKC